MVDVNDRARFLQCVELFYFGYRAFTSRPDRILGQRGLGRVHHRILYFVGRNPAITINALLDILKVSKQALNAPLRQLIEMKLVTTRVLAEDRRVKQLSLTSEGARLEGQLTATQVKQLSDAFASAGAASAEGWRNVMQAVSGEEQ
jgi:DNA-binding MarR family transcriptional regulator